MGTGKRSSSEDKGPGIDVQALRRHNLSWSKKSSDRLVRSPSACGPQALLFMQGFWPVSWCPQLRGEAVRCVTLVLLQRCSSLRREELQIPHYPHP